MTRTPTLVFTLLLAFLCTLAATPEAHAKRFGGGGSFGGKSAFGTPFKRSAARPARSPRQQQAAQTNQAARQGFAQRGGLMGMLGGLAIGGLLGALFFGGAFENLNFLDILVFGAIAFMLFKLLAARGARAAPQPAGASRGALGDDDTPAPRAAGSGFDSSSWFRGDAPGAPVPDATGDATPSTSELPADFDRATFLAGARRAFRDLQQAWDAHDDETLRALTTANMYAEVARRLEEVASDNRTDVLKVEAELLEVQDLGDMLEATVLFDTLIREAAGQRPQQVREVWHFTRARASRQPTWHLDGIQQLAD